jgi:hypothetical protein
MPGVLKKYRFSNVLFSGMPSLHSSFTNNERHQLQLGRSPRGAFTFVLESFTEAGAVFLLFLYCLH